MTGANFQPRRGDVFMADLSKSNLDAKCGRRPVVIIQNDKGNAYSTSVIAALVTSQKKKRLPTHVPLGRECGLRRGSTVLCEHIVTLEKKWLLSYMGTVVNTPAAGELEKAIKVSLSLKG